MPWLDAVLVNAAIDAPPIDSIEFVELDVEVLTSSIVRVRPRYRGPTGEAPASLIWKRSHEDVGRREAFAHGYVREVEFYREVAPTVDVSVPRCYAAGFDEVTGAHVLLLEDLAPGRRGDFLEGIDAERAVGVVRELARLHAARWSEAAPRGPEEFASYQTFFDRYTEPSATYLEQHTGGRVAERNRRYRTSVAGWFAELSEGPQTLCHSDAHAANVMFPVSPADRPYLLDWQAWRMDAGIRDIVRFVILGMAVEERRVHEHELLEAYLGALRARGVSYGVDVAQRDYRVASTLQWGWAVNFFRHEQIWDASTREAMPELVRRAGAAFDDAVGWLDANQSLREL